MKLYDYGWHLERFSKGFKKWQEGWFRIESSDLPTEEQQKELEERGWGREDRVTRNGAQVVLDEIKENGQ